MLYIVERREGQDDWRPIAECQGLYELFLVLRRFREASALEFTRNADDWLRVRPVDQPKD